MSAVLTLSGLALVAVAPGLRSADLLVLVGVGLMVVGLLTAWTEMRA